MMQDRSDRDGILEQLAEMIIRIKLPHPVRVAIDGVDAAGKTTLADELVNPLKTHGKTVIRSSADSFHNPRHIRYKRGVDSPEGYYLDSFQYEKIRNELLHPLGPGGSCYYRTCVYDIKIEKPVWVNPQKAPRDAILLFDGIFLMRSELIHHWDFKIFVDVDYPTSIERAMARDIPLFAGESEVDTIQMRYKQRYMPGQQMYIQEVHPKVQADIILVNSILDHPKIVKNRSIYSGGEF